MNNNKTIRNLCLFIDESGVANPKVVQSPVYILAGCSVTDQSRQKLKIEADQIKFKYWGRTDVVFHSKEMSRKEGEFELFKDVKVWHEFQKDLFSYLANNIYQLFFVIVDKEKAKIQNWAEISVYRETANLMVRNFILSLIAQGDCRGRLVVESATSEKDFCFHQSARLFLSRGIQDVEINFTQVQNVLTEISFVTKKNFDIEEQIADLLAYAAKLKYTEKKNLDSYEKRIIKIMISKLYRMNPNTGTVKQRYYSKINGIEVLPVKSKKTGSGHHAPLPVFSK